MKSSFRNSKAVSGLVFVAVFMLGMSFAGSPRASDRELEIRPDFVPGMGNPIGKTGLIEGSVVIVHSGEDFGYSAEKGLPLFTDDTIHSGKDGRVELVLEDESRITLAPETRLVLNRMVFAPEKKTRSFFTKLTGKARFLIRKLSGFKPSDVKVKTRTAVMGVRGSDFTVEAVEKETRISTFENTTLEVVPMADPDKLIIMQDFERLLVMEGERLYKVEKILQEDVDKIREGFDFVRPDNRSSTGTFEKKILLPKEALVEPDTIMDDAQADIAIDKGEIRLRSAEDAASQSQDIDRVIETHREENREVPFSFPEKPGK